jgi:hypothetical protein
MASSDEEAAAMHLKISQLTGHLPLSVLLIHHSFLTLSQVLSIV